MKKSGSRIDQFYGTFKKLRVNWLIHLTLLLLVSSCYTTKGLNYIQSAENSYSVPLIQVEYKVQPNDILNIKVKSRDSEQSNFFNNVTANNRNIEPNPASLFIEGYTVNSDGMINVPNVGDIKVSDLTVEEITEKVQKEIDKYLLNSVVSVKLTSFKISVLGDVKNPGTNYIYNTQANIFEALSAAGDLNVSAKRENIKLIRQVGSASKVVNLDLTSPSIIHSPYYFLHPNDVIYVESSKPSVTQKNLGLFSLVLSAITTTVLVLSFTTQ
ncbi:polysaccharide biosynthesis/export family protein [Maribacter algicola]|uniref:Polysaccharide biosynthesis/export family protein n=1 Tax=Meishania litoralis TaxID=3434685 RepID=A0ACC7LJA1_9FLAO